MPGRKYINVANDAWLVRLIAGYNAVMDECRQYRTRALPSS